MHYRPLGRTGLQISEIGFGGAPAGLRNYHRELYQQLALYFQQDPAQWESPSALPPTRR